MSKQQIVTITTTSEVDLYIKFKIDNDLMDRVNKLVGRLSFTPEWEKHIALFVVNEIKESLKKRGTK